ncbi:MAG TPA: hypothetical protein VFW75_14270 [Acetobacteraceae bacterium]|nr:hypothetical protein [Acetobacteraceae bacterium]
MLTQDQNRQLRSIEASGAPSTEELTRAVQAELATTLAALPWATRRAAARRVQPHVVDSFEQVVRSKLASAAEAEIACFVVARMAQRQLAAVQRLRNDAAMRGLVSMVLSGFVTQMFDIAARHEDIVDTAADRRRDAIRSRLAAGQMDAAEAARRTARNERDRARLMRMMETEVDDLIESFRQRLRAAMEELARAA